MDLGTLRQGAYGDGNLVVCCDCQLEQLIFVLIRGRDPVLHEEQSQGRHILEPGGNCLHGFVKSFCGRPVSGERFRPALVRLQGFYLRAQRSRELFASRRQFLYVRIRKPASGA